MRFLEIVSASNTRPAPDPAHFAKLRQSMADAIAAGTLVATGGIGKRATAAARVTQKDGKISVEDPPAGDGWMAAGGYSLTEFPTKEAAIENAKAKFALMGDGVIELIEVSAMHPRVQPAPLSGAAPMPPGVVPYLSIDGASEASMFYQVAFGAREVARMLAQDGKRLMHCQLEINGGALMLSDCFEDMGMPPVQRSSSYTMQLIVADGDAWWNRAIRAGCKEKLPFAVAPWGDKYGQLTDPYGVTWALNSPAQK